MKKHLLALAALATVSGVVAAQSVTIYGAIDSGITNASKSSATGSSQTQFLNGGLSPSILGFKSSEDLGGGLKAFANLEGHLSSADGSTGTWGGVFGRQTNVGVSGGFGTVTLGKQFNPAVLAFAATDPRGLKETYSGLITWLNAGNIVTATPASTSTVNSNSYSDIFLSNAVSYSTSVNGLNLGLARSTGGAPGNTSANSVNAVGASFSNSGVTVSASYTQDKGQLAATTGYSESKRSSVGVGYQLGQVGLKANYMEVKVNSISANTEAKKNEVYGVGADYNWNPSNTATLAYYDAKNKTVAGSTSKTWILSNDYALSKRTTVYALVASNKGGTSVTNVSSMGATYAGTTNTVTQLGINHKF